LWLEAHHPRSPEAWTQLFRRTFRFTGGQIVGEFLISIGCLPGSARTGLPGLSADPGTVALLETGAASLTAAAVL
jgi:hypothetical protein